MTVLNQLEKWISLYEKVIDTPKISEIKEMIEAFKVLEKEQLKDAYTDALDVGYMSASRNEEIDNDQEFETWYLMNYPKV